MQVPKTKQEQQRHEKRINSEIPRLVKITDEELKRKALWLKYAFTKERPTLEDVESGKDEARQCRIVCKDLKVVRRLPKVQTYSPTPSSDTFGLLLASVDTETEEVCTIDFTTEYLQTDGWPRSECPRTSEITWY